ncbi:alpha/beta-hydrolase [Testicularia cyperi]|uniref:Diphthamide biosynthesis protein 4 n=1 Tax=Testicularia cyperi TaxID=1882483 RepID=A0A317XZF1_9BASI|nr:alpha/beta-hydrolase [Testicularia cyperi]
MGQANSSFASSEAATVEIPGQGQIRGSLGSDKETSKPKSQRYTGIPFAQPPTGEHRWRRPRPLPDAHRYDSDGRTYEQFAALCPQPDNYALTNGIKFPPAQVPYSEDCLYLNIWCPVDEDGHRPREKLPVLFFIHGGWLQIGSARFENDREPSNLIGRSGVKAIVVTAAYRLNVFGFMAHDILRSEDADGLTGNYGFWDQRTALEWVHRNIEHFGGDPNNITVGGLSAGAHSTHSQLLYEFDRCQQDPTYTPIIRRVFQQSNAATWPSKPVEETHEQLDELCLLLSIPLESGPAEKIRRLREVEDVKLAKVLSLMNMHTFRATRDDRPRAFVKPDWTRAMMDGRFAAWCEVHWVCFVMGECDDEAWVYRYINTPTDKASLIRQLNNYYTYPLVAAMLPLYGVMVPKKPALTHDGDMPGTTSAADVASLYELLGVKPSATSTEIRAAYLDMVRKHHPDKLQQQQKRTTTSPDAQPNDATMSSDRLIRNLNRAYATLIDDGQRRQYDSTLATAGQSSAAAAAAAAAASPRISAVVDFESFQPMDEEGAEGSEAGLTFTYPCRCGSSYVIGEAQIRGEVDVVGCGGCSEYVRVRYDSGDLTPDEAGEIFGQVCSDSQVYIAERVLVRDLLRHVPAQNVLRYRINYRAKAIDGVLPQYKGVSHSFDDPFWWFSGLTREEEGKLKSWIQPFGIFLNGDQQAAAKEWYQGQQPHAKLIRVLSTSADIQIQHDTRWDDKADLIDDMVRIRQDLADHHM